MPRKLSPFDHPDLVEVDMWSEVAMRRRADSQRTQLEATNETAARLSATIIGEAGLALIALYLALAAVERYVAVVPSATGPLPTDTFADRLRVTRLGRDSVLHYSEKIARLQDTNIEVGSTGISIVAPGGRHSSQAEVGSITWADFANTALACNHWARERRSS